MIGAVAWAARGGGEVGEPSDWVIWGEVAIGAGAGRMSVGGRVIAAGVGLYCGVGREAEVRFGGGS